MSRLSSSGILSRRYVSAPLTITRAGSLTLAHGLGVIPKMISAKLVCAVAEGGYSVGEETPYFLVGNSSTNNRSFGVSIVPDAANLNLRFGAGSGSGSDSVFQLLNKSTGVWFEVTSSSWTLVVEAFA